MNHATNSSEYWTGRYQSGETGWDLGTVSKPLRNYFDQLQNKAVKILIPGAGLGHEAVYLFNNGFPYVHYLDFSPAAAEQFQLRCPDFPADYIHISDFFRFQGKFDLIVEHTFFSAIAPELRENYAAQMHHLLNKGGKLVGLFFNHDFNHSGPPYGGSLEEYRLLFDKLFIFKVFELSYNSIRPREGREHFIILEKK